MKINERSCFDVVIPVALQDINTLKFVIPYINEYLPVKQIVLIGSSGVEEKIKVWQEWNVIFINEDNIIRYTDIQRIICSITDDDERCVKRTGWYLQQFLKMQYANICMDDYYIVWDGDTIPIKSIEMMEDGNPVFHMKTEYYEPYFNTGKRLIKGFKKIISESFIAEHMFIHCETMRRLLKEIEDNTSIRGTKFYEKIMYCIDRDNIGGSGFSEFETYGTYCMQNYPNMYKMREWKSCREGNCFFDIAVFSKKDALWMSNTYSAISFEKSMEKCKEWKIYGNRFVQRFFSFEQVVKWFKNIKALKRMMMNTLKM